MKAKYMGAMAVSTAFTFELSDEQREIQLVVEVLPQEGTQVNPLLGALSLVHAYDGDIDRVRIGLEDTDEVNIGLRARDITDDQEPLEIIGLIVTKEGIQLEIFESDEDDDEMPGEVRYYPIAHEAFMADLMAFIKLHDPSYQYPIPETLELVNQSYTDHRGVFWDTREDPLRAHTFTQRAGDDICGWLEDDSGGSYLFVDYLHHDSGNEVHLANAIFHAYAERDEDDDNLVHYYATLLPETDDMYMKLVLRRSMC